MSQPSFAAFFRNATGADRPPYGYQCRLACGPKADPVQPEKLLEGTTCQSQLISIPTGLGKTAAVIMAWLWNRVQIPDSNWPRRLKTTS
jgi:CRISPR-associated endonuclease/helicase Cas3